MRTGDPRTEPGGRYAYYVLSVLFLVMVFNFVDRQIISILAEEIKADLGLDDAQIGFLYGTGFAVFYALFGVPLGRLADVWVRRTIISVGLAGWSVMTALSGTARSFLALGTYRIGVGVGEASAGPSANSLIMDYFPPRLRATALSLYASGVYIGAGIGIFLGGWIVDGWNTAFSETRPPFGLAGWQAAFFAVGLPGLLVAIWVRSLREPVRGQSDGMREATPHPHPFRELGRELCAVLPPLTLWTLQRSGAGSRRLRLNVAAGLLVALGAWSLVEWLGSPAQWIALGIGVYSTFSWAQSLELRDPVTFAMIFRSRTVLWGVIGFSWIAFTTYGLGFWAPPFFIRFHGVSAREAGTILGLTAASGGWLGINLGGVVSDQLKRRTAKARILMGFFTVALSVPVAVLLLTTPNVKVAYAMNFFSAVVSTLWIGPGGAMVNELVLPRMRGTMSAFWALMITFIGLALGPYSIGRISDGLAERGLPAQESLRAAMLLGLLPLVLTVICLAVAARSVAGEEATGLERARAAGEPLPTRDGSGTAGLRAESDDAAHERDKENGT